MLKVFPNDPAYASSNNGQKVRAVNVGDVQVTDAGFTLLSVEYMSLPPNSCTVRLMGGSGWVRVMLPYSVAV